MPLTAKQERFCEEYLVDLNATQAAIRAGYSENAASEIGYENLRKPQILEYVQELKAKRSERVQVTADDVLRRAWEIANLDVSDCFDEDGNLVPVDKMPSHVRKSLQSFEIASIDDVAVTGKIRIPDRLKAIELAGKHNDVQAFKEVVEHHASSELEEIFKQSGHKLPGARSE